MDKYLPHVVLALYPQVRSFLLQSIEVHDEPKQTVSSCGIDLRLSLGTDRLDRQDKCIDRALMYTIILWYT
jgi:hypothetical protein